jgi:hypothetical protein
VKPPVADEVRQLAAALRKSNAALVRAEEGVAALRAVVDAVVDILVAKGVLNEGHERFLGKLRERVGAAFGQKVRLRSYVDKYAVEGAEIDCEARLHLCQARCCSFSVELTAQDLEEGGISWALEDPYMLRREEDGFCTHLDRDGGGCAIYRRRPAACREFDCRDDRRVWIDFEGMIPAPMPPGLVPLASLGRREDR